MRPAAFAGGRFSQSPDGNQEFVNGTALFVRTLAGRSKSLDALKKLKPDPRLDKLSDLLQAATLSESKELIDYLLHLSQRCIAATSPAWNGST